MPIVECKDVTKIYEQGRVRVKALDGINLTIDRGAFMAIAGPSGSGKTTLLNLIGGLDSPNQGAILLNGQALDRMNPSALAELRLHLADWSIRTEDAKPVPLP